MDELVLTAVQAKPCKYKHTAFAEFIGCFKVEIFLAYST